MNVSIYFDSAYYIVPGGGGEKDYFLLKEASETRGKVGIGRITMHGKEHLVALRPFGDGMLMETMHYADEIRNPKEFPELSKPMKIEKEELELAEQLIDLMKKPFKYEDYRDRYHEALTALIEAKLSGKKEVVEVKIPEIKPTKDLMKALKASIKAKKK